MLVVRVLAPLDHMEPRCVGWTDGFAHGMSVLEIASGEFFSMSAAAAGDAATKVADGSLGEIPTIASAFPDGLLTLFPVKQSNSQATEPLTCKVFERWHGVLFNDSSVRKQA